MDTEPVIDKLNRRALFEKVKRNNDALDACLSHDFSIDLTPRQQLNKRWQCSHCGGNVDAIEKHWYEQGRKHEFDRNIQRRQVADLILKPDDSALEYECVSSIESSGSQFDFYIASPLSATQYKVSVTIEEV